MPLSLKISDQELRQWLNHNDCFYVAKNGQLWKTSDGNSHVSLYLTVNDCHREGLIRAKLDAGAKTLYVDMTDHRELSVCQNQTIKNLCIEMHWSLIKDFGNKQRQIL